MKATPGDIPTYMPQLDSLRFFAVLGVLVSHYWIPAAIDWGSCGNYVYHYFVSYLLVPVASFLKLQYDAPGFMNFVVSSLVTIAIASVSWHWIESPINAMKNRFHYSPKAQASSKVSEGLREGLN